MDNLRCSYRSHFQIQTDEQRKRCRVSAFTNLALQWFHLQWIGFSIQFNRLCSDRANGNSVFHQSRLLLANYILDFIFRQGKINDIRHRWSLCTQWICSRKYRGKLFNWSNLYSHASVGECIAYILLQETFF